MDADDGNSGSNMLVKWVIGISGTLVLTGILWLATTVQDGTKQNVTLGGQINVLSTKIDNLTTQMASDKLSFEQQITDAKGNTADRYTSRDADKDLRVRDNQISHNTTEIEGLNRRIEALENRGRK